MDAKEGVLMVDYESSLTTNEQKLYPEWIGLYRQLKQEINETQGSIEGRCFI